MTTTEPSGSRQPSTIACPTPSGSSRSRPLSHIVYSRPTESPVRVISRSVAGVNRLATSRVPSSSSHRSSVAPDLPTWPMSGLRSTTLPSSSAPAMFPHPPDGSLGLEAGPDQTTSGHPEAHGAVRAQVDVLEQADGHEPGEHRRPAVGHQRERHTRHRHDAQAHPDVLERLEAEPAGDATGG